MKIEKRIDPLTGEEFIPKKSSQRFATPSNRIRFNNNKAGQTRAQRAYLEKPLHQNHVILSKLLGNSKEIVVHEEFLLGKGYNFKLTTHNTTYQGENKPALYEFIIITLPQNQIKIVRK